MPPSISTRPSRRDRPEYCGDGRRSGESRIEARLPRRRSARGRSNRSPSLSAELRAPRSVAGRRPAGRPSRMRSMSNWARRRPPCTISASVPARARHMRLATSLRAAEHRSGIVVNVAAAHAGRHARAHDRADRGAGDRHRPDAQFVERLDGVDVRKPARAAAPEGDREARSIRRAASRRSTPALLPGKRPDDHDRRLRREQPRRRGPDLLQGHRIDQAGAACRYSRSPGRRPAGRPAWPRSPARNRDCSAHRRR